MRPVLTPDELVQRLEAIGAPRYHDKHPFHALLHAGRCTKAQVQAWALNRYYYQASIPAKDASLLARLPSTALRREWRRPPRWPQTTAGHEIRRRWRPGPEPSWR